MTAKYDLEIDRGETFSPELTWLDENELPIDVTGYTAKMQLRSKERGHFVVELSTENGRITLGGATGVIRLNLESTVTRRIDWTRGEYDLFLIAPGGQVERLIAGNVKVAKAVTVL